MWLWGTVIPIIPQSLKTSAKEYAESDSDLGDDEERILMHARWSTISQDDVVDDVSTLKWRLNLSERAWQFFITQSMAIKLIYSRSLSPEKFSVTKGKMRTGRIRWTVTTTFSRSKIWRPPSLHSGKDHIDPEGLKRWEDEEMLDSIRHLFITEEDGDRPIVEG